MSMTERWLGYLPKDCEICGDEIRVAFVDGKTIAGQWAKMCTECHSVFGVGLGTGLGQKYSMKTGEKLEG